MKKEREKEKRPDGTPLEGGNKKKGSNTPISCVTPYQTTERVRGKGKKKKSSPHFFAGVRAGNGRGHRRQQSSKSQRSDSWAGWGKNER